MRPFPFAPMPASLSSTDPLQFRLNVEESVQMTRFLRLLVQTPSPSSGESAVADLIMQELLAIGIADVFRDSVGNVIARLGNGLGPTLMFDAHMDTVTPTDADWHHGAYTAAIEDGMLYGLGAADDKGSIAALVYGIKKLIDSQIQLQGNLLLAFTVQQEPCEGCALRLLLKETNVHPDWIVLAEPSDLTIKRGHRGRVLFKVTVHGRSSHSSRPDLGDNAITAAARLIFSIDLLAGSLANDPFLGPGTIAVTHIESRSASANAIPDACTFYVDRRLTSGETPGRAQVQIENVIEREGILASVEVMEYEAASYTGHNLHTRQAFNAWALEQEHPLVNALSLAAQTVVGKPPIVGNWSFSTDGVFSMAEAGIATVGFGPGDPDVAHTVDESVRLDDVATAAQTYALLSTMLLSRA